MSDQTAQARPGSTAKPRIVVIGAGFGGLAAVQRLDPQLAEIVLIDRTNHHLFQPLLYQVATASLSPAEIATASRTLVRGDRVRVIMAEVTGIDVNKGAVLLADGTGEDFDHLIVAVGSRYSFFGHDEWRDHAFVLKSLDDAITIRNHLLDRFEVAARETDPAELQRHLTFVIVGGGPTGVELAGTIAEFIRAVLPRDFPALTRNDARVILCEGGKRLLSPFSDEQSAYAASVLGALDVDVRLDEAVADIAAGEVTVGTQTIATDTVLWCAGTAPLPVADWLGVKPAKKGGTRVGDDCSVPGHSHIFVIGDAASFTGADGKSLPALAPVAKQQGRFVGDLLNARLAGRATSRRFQYQDWGILAVIGRSRAVAQFGKVRLKGLPAWLTWAVVHLGLLIDYRSRLLVYIDWTWEWLHGNRGDRLIVHPEEHGVRGGGTPPRQA